MSNIRFDRFDNGNPAENDMKARSPNVPMSAFDFSMTHCGNTMIGLFAPIDCFDVVPREKIQMSATALLEFRNPTTRQIMNGFRVYFHSRYMRLDHIWEGAHNFIDKGRSGHIDLQQPALRWRFDDLSFTFHDQEQHMFLSANTPMSLINFLGMPAEVLQLKGHKVGSGSQGDDDYSPLWSFAPASCKVSDLGTAVKIQNNATDFLPAAPFFMYQKVWRDHYCNKNLLQGNKYWFPDNEDHFILSYSCGNATSIIYEDEDLLLGSTADSDQHNINRALAITGQDPFDVFFNQLRPHFGLTYYNNLPPDKLDSSSNPHLICRGAPSLASIKFVQFRGDRFTTANPFPDLIRGDIPAFSSLANLPVTGSNSNMRNSQFSQVFQYPDDSIRGLNSDLTDYSSFQVENPLATLDMSAFYTLETITAFKRKLGMTNGDYNEAIKAQFGESAHAYERSDQYIGGFYQDFNISAVTQNSESANTPLGTKAGQGVSAGSGNLGFIDVPDYGWIQTYMFIVPDVYYTHGKPRQYSKKNFVDMYFPLFNNLPAQEIRNDEICITGNTTTDSSPWAYEDRYAEYKSRTNRVSGFMGLSYDAAYFDASRIMARRYAYDGTGSPVLPRFNSTFVTLVPENTDMEVFTVTTEPPFDFQVALNVRRVSPMPFMAIEGSLSSPGLNA